MPAFSSDAAALALIRLIEHEEGRVSLRLVWMQWRRVGCIKVPVLMLVPAGAASKYSYQRHLYPALPRLPLPPVPASISDVRN